MVKTQIQLPEEDLKTWRRMAAEEGISVSELVRRGMRQIVRESKGPSREELWRRASSLVGKYHSGKSDISERHDDNFAEAIADDNLR